MSEAYGGRIWAEQPQPFTDDELTQARNAPLGWTARRWLATVDALRAEAGPWPKFCPWCMAEFHADGTVTPPASAGPAAPTGDDDHG